MNIIKQLRKKKYFKILEYQRAHDSRGNKAFIKDFLYPELTKYGEPYIDDAGNVILKAGDSKTVFSSHHDTMHNRHFGEVKQKLVIDENLLHLVSKGKQCLGADDGSGIWLMLQLLEEGIEGLYIFHAGEERGGIGSTYIRDVTPELLQGYERAIAFDRAYTSHVITHQFGKRLASKTAARFFANELNTLMPKQKTKWAPNDGGSFTDTANYQKLIPECFNLSVGYYYQHSQNEYQDLGFLWELGQVIADVDWEAMPTERDPSITAVSKYAVDFAPFMPRKKFVEAPIIVEDDWLDTPVDVAFVDAYQYELCDYFARNDISQEYLLDEMEIEL